MKYLIGYVFIGLLISGMIMPIIQKRVEENNPDTPKQRKDFIVFLTMLLMAAVWPVAVGAMMRRIFAKRT
jgi:hypothetical protein